MDAAHVHDHHEHKHDHAHGSNGQAWAKTAILLGMGLYFAYTIASGNLPNYINVAFAWLSYVAAGLFLALGALSARRLLRPARHDHAHDHGGLSWGALAIVAVPLLLGILIPSNALPPEAAQGSMNTASISAARASAFVKPPLERNVLDWLREFNRATSPAAFNGQEADVIGFVYREPGFAPDQFMAARFTISCCVADASAIGLPVSAENAASIPDGEWVRVRGAFEVGDFRGQQLPVLHAESLVVVDQPEQPYLYP